MELNDQYEALMELEGWEHVQEDCTTNQKYPVMHSIKNKSSGAVSFHAGCGNFFGCGRHHTKQPPREYTTRDQVLSAAFDAGLGDRNDHALRVAFINALRNATAKDCPKNRVGASMVTDVDLLLAPVEYWREALLKATKKWRVGT